VAGVETAVLLVVPEADALVDGWRQRSTPPPPPGVPAHVTLLSPFLPQDRVDAGVLAELGWFFAGVDAFRVRFEQVGWFHDTCVVYLDPAGRDLNQLIASLARRWPECPLEFPDPQAHLTVLQSPDPALRAEAGAAMAPGLPIEVAVTQAELWVRGADGRWSQTAVFPLGEAER
jgi:hypothetical protein